MLVPRYSSADKRNHFGQYADRPLSLAWQKVVFGADGVADNLHTLC